MKRKSLAFVGNSSWSMFRFREFVLKYFIDQGYEVFVYAPQDESTSRLIEIGCRFRSFKLSRKGLNPFGELLVFLQLYLMYLRDRPNLIFHYTVKPNIWGSFAAALAGIPSVAVTTGLGSVFVRQNALTKILQFLYKFSLFFASQVWFLNENDRIEFVSGKIIPTRKAQILPSEGIDVDEFPFESGFPEPATFLLIARMLWDKGVGEFVKAAEKLRKTEPHVRFQLLGPIDSENPSSISIQQIRQWDTSGIIEYLGSVDDVKPFIKKCTAIVLPTLYREGVPRVLMEGAAMGRILIASDSPGCRDLIQHGQNGYLIAPANDQNLVCAFEKIIRLPKTELEKMSEHSRQIIVDSFCKGKILDKYTNYLRSQIAFNEL